MKLQDFTAQFWNWYQRRKMKVLVMAIEALCFRLNHKSHFRLNNNKLNLSEFASTERISIWYEYVIPKNQNIEI